MTAETARFVLTTCVGKYCTAEVNNRGGEDRRLQGQVCGALGGESAQSERQEGAACTKEWQHLRHALRALLSAGREVVFGAYQAGIEDATTEDVKVAQAPSGVPQEPLHDEAPI